MASEKDPKTGYTKLNRLSPTLKSNFKTPQDMSPQVSIGSQLSDDEDKANFQSVIIHQSSDEIIHGKIN